MDDVIIVGGGPAGLAAAAWCARERLRVQVVERAQLLGGRARTHLVAGHALNQGGHALYRGGAAARGLAELGVTYSGHPPPTSGLIAIAGGELHRLPSGIVSILATDLFGFGAKIEAARALARIARPRPRHRPDPRGLDDLTWREWVDRIATRPEVRDVLDAFARLTTYANAPDRASAAATIAQIRLGIDPGVLYVDGGWQTLVDGLESAALNAGAKILRGAPVASIARVGGELLARRAGGEEASAHAAIVCAGPATARTLLGEPSLGGLLPLHAACLDLGLSELPRPDRVFALGIDRPTYFSVHSASARLAETGATLHVMKYLDPAAANDAAADERELEEMVDRLQPGWRAHVRARRYSPNLVATNALVEAKTRRPDVDAAGIEGVFVAGDWVGSEGMLVDAAIASARVAAQRAIAYISQVARDCRRHGAPAATIAAS